MNREPRPDVGYDNLDCPETHWKAFLDLGKAFGWQPKGMLVRSNDNRQGMRDMRYAPGMYGVSGGWLPVVELDDARAWAEALDRVSAHMKDLGIALPKPKGPFLICESLTPEQYELLIGDIRLDHIKAFTAYLHRGVFGSPTALRRMLKAMLAAASGVEKIAKPARPDVPGTTCPQFEGCAALPPPATSFVCGNDQRPKPESLNVPDGQA